MAEVSDTETMFLNTKVYKDKRFAQQSRLDVKIHFKASKRFQYTHFLSCHPPRLKKGFIQGEPFRLLRTNSSETAFETAISQFKANPIERGYPETQYRPSVLKLKQILMQNWHLILSTTTLA